ncbi:MAG: UMP kinase [Chloroflexi bacterium]|nr:UMP kinase [Chloroflexota bacterium]
MSTELTGTPKYSRVLLKLGGEALSGENGFGIDPQRVVELAKKIKAIKQHDIEVAVVIGAGNLWRGRIGLEAGMDRATADYMGMIATVMNALAMQDALERQGIVTRVQTAIEMRTVAEPYIRLRAIRHLEKGRVVIMAAGTGNPFFTTDSAAALRANEINAEVMIKATKVDGVYDSDPKTDSSATRYEHMTFMEALNMRVGVLDSTALTLCMDNSMPIIVMNLWEDGALQKAILGQSVGTMIS